MALQHFKEESRKTNKMMKNMQVFLNMIIHDLRNPTNQINFSIKYALEKMRIAENLRKDHKNKIIQSI